MPLRAWFVRTVLPEVPVLEEAPAPREEVHGRGQRDARGRALAALAAGQHGVVDLSDLTALGFTRSAVSRRVAAGALHRVHRGVYAVGHASLGAEGRRFAAVRAYGREAVLSHRDAAALHGLRPTARAAVDVTAPVGRHGSHRDVTLHRSAVPAAQRAVVAGIPCTTVARTLVDLGDVIAPRGVERCVEEAVRRETFDLAEARAAAEARHGTRGAAVLRALLAAWDGGTWTRSALEERLLAVVDGAGLPRPRCNLLVAGVEVDAAWPAAQLAVEVDEFAFHGRTRGDFERDRDKEAVLDAAGWRLVRLGWHQVDRRPAEVAARLRRHLGACP